LNEITKTYKINDNDIDNDNHKQLVYTYLCTVCFGNFIPTCVYYKIDISCLHATILDTKGENKLRKFSKKTISSSPSNYNYNEGQE